MKDIANQLILRWARQVNARTSATEDFTRLTLDTITLCSMGYHFNSFYQESMHPFVEAMVNILAGGWLKIYAAGVGEQDEIQGKRQVC